MGYEFRESDLYAFASAVGAETMRKRGELWFRFCPYCEGGRNHDKNTFSVNLSTGAFKCLRASCAKQGHFVQLCKDFNFKLDRQYELKEYKRVPQPREPFEPTEEAIWYLLGRKIDINSILKYEITTTNDPNVLVFPFYDENNVLTFIKFRNISYKRGDPGNKEWCEADEKPILFGMNHCKGFDRLIITEGQIDSLSVDSCFVPNAVSVPTGAAGFTWYENCQAWIEKFKEIVVFGDCENGKITLVDGLKARLPASVRLKVVRQQDYKGEKDANAILQKYGKEAIINAIKNAVVETITQTLDLAKVEKVDVSRIPRIRSGIREIDKTIGGFLMGTVTLLSGKRGMGKSTLLSQFIANALDQGETVFAYSGELPAYLFKFWLNAQLAGADNLSCVMNEYGEYETTIDKNIDKQISDWYQGRMYVYDNDFLPDMISQEKPIIDVIESAIQQYSPRLVCIDNLMIAMDTLDAKDNVFTAQSIFVGRLKRLAMKYNIAIILVAHPRKGSMEFDNDDISGSADIGNKVDVIMAYKRVKDAEENGYNGKLVITKNRYYGDLRHSEEADGIPLMYAARSKRIISAQESRGYKYGWQQSEKADVGSI